MALLRPRVDPWALCAVLLLAGVGLVLVYSSSAVFAAQGYGDGAYFLKRQALFFGLGMAGFVVAASMAPALWERLAWPLLAFAFVLLFLVLIPGIGHSAGGARRWIQLGPLGLQAGEVMKLALVVYLAQALARKQGDRMKSFKLGVLAHFVVPGVAMALLLGEPDFGTAMLLLGITFIMLFVGGARVGYLAGALALAVPVAVFFVSSTPYRMRRVLAFLDPWAHRSDIGYQITESLMTVGSGGFLGLGLGESKQKLFFLPAAHTDFVFAVAGEELGFVGLSLLLLAFGVLSWRAYLAVRDGARPFDQLLALGVSSLLLLQAIFNIAVVLGLVPTKGITLPFVSYGGSSLLSSLFLAGVLSRLIAEARDRAGLEPRPGVTSRLASLSARLTKQPQRARGMP